MAEKYFLKLGSKSMGPFSIEQLESLRERGRLQSDTRVSVDRKNWQPASTLTQLFPGSARQDRVEIPAEQDSAAPQSAAQDDKWFYSQGNEEHGPVTWEKLSRLAKSGEIAPDDMVWTEGYDDWKTVNSVDGLLSDAGSPAMKRVKQSKTYQNYQRIASSRFWDGVLGFVRTQISAQDLENACRTLLQIGNYSVMVAMVAGPAFLLVQGIKVDSIRVGLMSVALFFGLAVLKYIAQRMSVAAHEVVSASQSRLSSPAFCDSIAVALLFFAIGSACSFTFLGIQQTDISGTILYIIIGAQFLITFGYAGCTALHPNWINVNCSSPVTAGEEGIGVISVLLKIWLRFAPINYGVGAIFGALGYVVALILILAGGKWLLLGYTCGYFSTVWLITVCLIPAVAYLLMVIFSIGLDLVQSVMLIPEKLDAMAANRDSTVD